MAAIATAGGFGLITQTTAQAGEVSDCSVPSGVLEPSDLAHETAIADCDLEGRVVQNDEGLAVEIPADGEAVTLEARGPDGSATTFSVDVATDGEITVAEENDSPKIPGAVDDEWESDDALGRAQAAPACTQGAYNNYGRKWVDEAYVYRMGDGPRPAGLTSAEFRDVIIDSANNITKSYNDCGRADNVSATQSYAGQTTVESFVTNSAGVLGCKPSDGISTVDAGVLPGKAWDGAALGVACTHSEVRSGKDKNIEVDIRLNTTHYNWTTTPRAASCKAAADSKDWKFDVESVLTHEFGHGFGLGHVSEASYPTLTMSTDAETRPRSATLWPFSPCPGANKIKIAELGSFDGRACLGSD